MVVVIAIMICYHGQIDNDSWLRRKRIVIKIDREYGIDNQVFVMLNLKEIE